MPRLTKRAVESVLPGAKDIILWDSDIRGFGCKITPKGKRVYFAYYRTSDGTQRRPSIGAHGTITCDTARRIAKDWFAEVAAGGDPGGDRKAARNAATVDDLCTRYLEEHAKVHMTARSFGGDERLINRHIRPALGGRKVAGVTRDDVTKLHYAMRSTPVEANRTVGVISRMFNVAEGWKLRAPDTNPTHKLKKYKETARRRFLSDDETARLGAALAEAEHTKTERPASIAAVRLLLLTGCRLGEILTLQWDWVDIPNACIRLPQSKTGPKDVHLNAPALEVLTNIERHKDNPHVIIGTRKGQHLVNLQKPWTRIKKKAALKDLRLHDLRHTFASVGVARGLGLPIIGKALGHNSTQTTGRYAHLDSDPVKQAVEIIGTQIAAAMKGESAEVVNFEKRRTR